MSHVKDVIGSALTLISPVLNTRVRYFHKFKSRLNLKNPTTFNEKMIWLKLNKYMYDPLVIQCADKVRVREYVEQCDCGDILNSVLGVYDSPNEIPWDTLPNQFALKWNFGAGMNIICSDKSKLRKDEVIKKLNHWKNTKCWLPCAEMQYKYAPKKIICEEFIHNECDSAIPDYKVYCFNGEPKAIFVMHGRDTEIKTEFFDTEWNQLPNTNHYGEPEHPTSRPACLDKMLNISRILSNPFPFVRCDFYVVNNRLYFGELTFTPSGCLDTSETVVDGKTMAELLDISDLVAEYNMTKK